MTSDLENPDVKELLALYAQIRAKLMKRLQSEIRIIEQRLDLLESEAAVEPSTPFIPARSSHLASRTRRVQVRAHVDDKSQARGPH